MRKAEEEKVGGREKLVCVTKEFKYSRKHPALGLLSNFFFAQWAQCTRKLLEQTQLGAYGTGNTQKRGKTP